jgi:hypothetical protein
VNELNNFITDLASGSWISLLFAFAVLPWFYLRYAFETQKEYLDLAKTVFSNDGLKRPDKRRLSEWSDRSLHVFQLEWGLVCAIAVLILANFCSVLLVDISPLAKDSCIVATKAAASAAQSDGACGRIKLLLSIYSIATALMIFFQILWARAAAIRRLRELYFAEALKQPYEQRINSPNEIQAARTKPVRNGLGLANQR